MCDRIVLLFSSPPPLHRQYLLPTSLSFSFLFSALHEATTPAKWTKRRKNRIETGFSIKLDSFDRNGAAWSMSSSSSSPSIGARSPFSSPCRNSRTLCFPRLFRLWLLCTLKGICGTDALHWFGSAKEQSPLCWYNIFCLHNDFHSKFVFKKKGERENDQNNLHVIARFVSIKKKTKYFWFSNSLIGLQYMQHALHGRRARHAYTTHLTHTHPYAVTLEHATKRTIYA